MDPKKPDAGNESPPVSGNDSSIEGIANNTNNDSGHPSKNENDEKDGRGLYEHSQVNDESLDEYIKIVEELGCGIDPHSDYDADDIHQVVYMAELLKNLRAVRMQHARMLDQMNIANIREKYLREIGQKDHNRK